MKSKTREKLLQMDIVSKIEGGHTSLMIPAVAWVLVGIAIMVIGRFILQSEVLYPRLAIGGLVVGAFIILASPLSIIGGKRLRRRLIKDIDRIKEHHGGLEAAVNEIKQHLYQDNLPAYTITVNDKFSRDQFHIAGQWYVNLRNYELIRISEIASITDGGLGAAKLNLNNGESRETRFGLTGWGWDKVFDLFHEANPQILRGR